MRAGLKCQCDRRSPKGLARPFAREKSMSGGFYMKPTNALLHKDKISEGMRCRLLKQQYQMARSRLVTGGSLPEEKARENGFARRRNLRRLDAPGWAVDRKYREQKAGLASAETALKDGNLVGKRLCLFLDPIEGNAHAVDISSCIFCNGRRAASNEQPSRADVQDTGEQDQFVRTRLGPVAFPAVHCCSFDAEAPGELSGRKTSDVACLTNAFTQSVVAAAV